MILLFSICTVLTWIFWVRPLIRKKGILIYNGSGPTQMMWADWSELFRLVRETSDPEARNALRTINFFALCTILTIAYRILTYFLGS